MQVDDIIKLVRLMDNDIVARSFDRLKIFNCIEVHLHYLSRILHIECRSDEEKSVRQPIKIDYIQI